MTILIDLTVAGVNTGPFNLYSDADEYTSAFATNITREQLLDGYPAVVDAGTTNIKLQSLSDICPNDTILPVNATTSTTSTSTSSTTSTTTTLNCLFVITAQEVTVIPTVLICDQNWTTKNLDVETYSDGTPIPQVTDPSQWASMSTGAWCYYNNDPANNATYGKLYNWYAVAGISDSSPNTQIKKLAPLGYHIPSDEEWTTLNTCLGGQAVAGGKMKSTGTIQAGNGLWESPNEAATNLSGFTALPGGSRSYGSFAYMGSLGYWWSSTEYLITTAWRLTLLYDSSSTLRGSSDRRDGFSVRLIKD